MALFTTAEARAFSLGGTTPLSVSGTYSDDLITAAAARIKERFENICGVAFESTASVVHTFDGDGSNEALLPNVRVSAVSAATNDGTALTTAEKNALAIYPHGLIVWDGGTWLKGYRNCTITYTHGHASVPTDIKRAALIAAVEELALQGNSHADLHATSMTDDLGRLTRFAIPTGAFGRWYGVPEIDSVLVAYYEKRPAIA